MHKCVGSSLHCITFYICFQRLFCITYQSIFSLSREINVFIKIKGKNSGYVMQYLQKSLSNKDLFVFGLTIDGMSEVGILC